MFSDESILRELNLKKREVRLLSSLQTLRNGAKSSAEFLKLMTDELTKAFNTESGIALLYNFDKRKILIEQRVTISEMDEKTEMVLKKLANESMKSNQPIMYNKILNQNLANINIHNIFILPLNNQKKNIGAIQLVNKKSKRGFTTEDLAFFNSVSEQISYAFNESVKDQVLSTEAKTYSILYDFERAKNLGADVYDTITTQIVKSTSADLCVVMKINKKGWEIQSTSNSRLSNKKSSAKLNAIAEETIIKRKSVLSDRTLSIPFKDKSGAVLLFSKDGFSDFEIDFAENTIKKMVF